MIAADVAATLAGGGLTFTALVVLAGLWWAVLALGVGLLVLGLKVL